MTLKERKKERYNQEIENTIGDLGTEMICKALKANSTLTELNLRGNERQL